jgi:hypothetical protein
MAGTADDNSTVDLFDDQRWLSLDRVHWSLCQKLFGDPDVTALEMSEAFATAVPTMVRSRWRWTDRERKSFGFWNDYDILWQDHHLVGSRRLEHVLDRAIVIDLAGYYAWLPALAERWPTVFASTPTSAAPSKPPPEPEEWLGSLKPEFDRLPRKQKSAWVRDVAFPRMQIELGDKAPWKSWESLKRAFYSGRGKKRKKI